MLYFNLFIIGIGLFFLGMQTHVYLMFAGVAVFCIGVLVLIVDVINTWLLD